MSKKKKSVKPRKISKLTAKVKQRIKNAKGKVPLSAYKDEALTYLRKYKGLAKARRIKASEALKIGSVRIAKGSDLYKIAKALADSKGISVSKLSQDTLKNLAELDKTGKLFFNKEFDNAIIDVNKSSAVSNKDERREKKKVDYQMTMLKNTAIQQAKIYPYLNIEYYITLQGHLFIKYPDEDEYLPFASMDEESRVSSWRDLLDEYEIGYTPNE